MHEDLQEPAVFLHQRQLPIPAVAKVLAELAQLVPVVYQRAVVARQH